MTKGSHSVFVNEADHIEPQWALSPKIGPIDSERKCIITQRSSKAKTDKIKQSKLITQDKHVEMKQIKFDKAERK